MGLAFLLLLFAVSVCARRTVVSGAGATTTAPVYQEWTLAYRLIRPDIDITYTSTSSALGLAAAQAGSEDYASTITPFSATDATNNPDLRLFPSVGCQICIMVNIPGLAKNSLNLTRNALAGIFAGQIDRWDHPEILGSNPAATPEGMNASINVIYRSDNAGASQTLTLTLQSFNATVWPYGQVGKFPSNVTVLPNFKAYLGTTAVSGVVQSTLYSIGYGELAYALADAVSVARAQNARGQFVSPIDRNGTSAAFDALDLNPVTNAPAQIVDLDGPQVYPFLSVGYLILNIHPNVSHCDEYRETLKMFRWALTDPAGIELATEQGGVPLPPTLRETVLTQWFALTCDGKLALGTEYIQQHSSPLVKIVLAFSMLLWVISLGLVFAAWWFSSKGRTPILYTLCLGFGASCAFASIVLFYEIPKHTYICQLRQWLLACGLTCLLGIMFSRGWQLHALYKKKSSPTTSADREIISTTWLFVIVGAIIGVQLLLLILWTSIDKFESRASFLNSIDLRARYSCECDHPIVWLLLELGFFLCLLGWGLFVVYRTWSSRAAVDSRWTLIAVYNTLIAFFIVIPLLATVADTDDWIFYIAALAVDFAVTSAVFSIYGSALLRRIWDSVRQSNSHSHSREAAEPPTTFRTAQTTSIV